MSLLLTELDFRDLIIVVKLFKEKKLKLSLKKAVCCVSARNQLLHDELRRLHMTWFDTFIVV